VIASEIMVNRPLHVSSDVSGDFLVTITRPSWFGRDHAK